MKSILAISAAAFCFCAAPAAEAALVADISVINRNTGERLPTYRHAGKLYVAGKPGDRYALELKNRTGFTLKLIRDRRERGLRGHAAIDWTEAITGTLTPRMKAALRSHYKNDEFRD